MKYRIEKDILWKVVDDEVVIVDPRKDAYSYLNSTGKEIWQMIAKGCTFDKIVEHLRAQYEGTAAQIEHDSKSLLQELLRANLIREE